MKQLNVSEFIAKNDLSNSFILAYYGGGNFGDELLCEVLTDMLIASGATQISAVNTQPDRYFRYHKDRGVTIVDSRKRGDILGAVFRSKTIIVGGGGLWGLDFNLNVFLMSCILFFSRVFLRKRVFLLGVGYYNSTNAFGRFGAWLAGRFANAILARDPESYKNFALFSSGNTYLCEDAAFSLKAINTEQYAKDAKRLWHEMSPEKDVEVLIGMRRFENSRDAQYKQAVETWLEHNLSRQVMVALFEPKSIDPVNWHYLEDLSARFPNVRIMDSCYNPVALYVVLCQHRSIQIVAPQFHVMLVAALADVRFLPFSYDNKVSELFEKLHIAQWRQIDDIDYRDLKEFLG